MLRLIGSSLLFATTALAATDAERQHVNDLMQHRQWVEAEAVLTKVVAVEPGNAEAYFFLGRVQIARGELDGAVAAFERATSLQPAQSEYFRLLGDAYGISAQKAGLFAKIGWARKCKAAYDKSITLDPANLKARWSLLEYCRQAPGIVGGGMDQAYAQAAEIKKLDPPRGRQAFASLYLDEKKYAQLLAEFDEVLKVTPDDYTSLYQVGRFAASSGQFLDRGLAALRRCLDLPVAPGEPGRAPTHWRIGNILSKQGDKPGARAAYEAAIKADSQFPQAIESLRKL